MQVVLGFGVTQVKRFFRVIGDCVAMNRKGILNFNRFFKRYNGQECSHLTIMFFGRERYVVVVVVVTIIGNRRGTFFKR